MCYTRSYMAIPATVYIWRELIVELRKQGYSCAGIAEELNRRGIKTPFGKWWKTKNVATVRKSS